MPAHRRGDLANRYGPWAIVVGASEGVGASVADELAAGGLDLLLIARNAALLEEVAGNVRTRHRVEVRTHVQDLLAPEAVEQILAAAAALEVGLLVYTPGAVHNADLFLDQPLALSMRMIQLNCTVPVV